MPSQSQETDKTLKGLKAWLVCGLPSRILDRPSFTLWSRSLDLHNSEHNLPNLPNLPTIPVLG